MMLNILANHFRRHLVAHRAREVAVFPELPAPQLSLHLRVLSKDGSRTQALKPRHHLRYRVARRKRTEDMHVVNTNFHLVYGDVVLLGYLGKHLAHALGNRALQNLLAILWRPYQVVRSVIGGVGCATENHVGIVANPHHLGSGIEPPAKMVHPSPPQAAGHSEPFS